MMLGTPYDVSLFCNTVSSGSARAQTVPGGCSVSEVELPPEGCVHYHNTLLTPGAVAFVSSLVKAFSSQVDEILQQRARRKLKLDETKELPDFSSQASEVRHGDWKVCPIPKRLQCRHVDLGDVSPSNTQHFVAALKSTAQGIQTDFDDGHCPSWRNQLTGLYNVYRAVHNEIPDVPDISSAPVLMLRPRAWNMIEHNMMVCGRKVPGPLFDFGLLMYHNAQILVNCDSGPFFYLPKLEGYLEARLWNNVFSWTEQKLSLPPGCVKACVLIENVLASFELHEILYELRDHSAGLNCGIWDYSASFVNKLGTRPDFMLPDRNKYVSMDKHFLKSYMDLVIQTCHGHGALATGGMSALLLPSGDKHKYQEVMEKACSAKMKEIQAGADGFMVYDLGLVAPMQQLFREHTPGPNQLEVMRKDVKVTAKDLLRMPPGGVTLGGLKHNIAVGILFIEAWLRGRGHFYLKGCVEDSATAEISRSQVWQWLRHRAPLEDASSPTVVTRRLVRQLIRDLLQQMFLSVDHSFTRNIDRCHLVTAAGIFEEVVTKRDFPEFITTYLYEEHAFLMAQANMESVISDRKSKL